MNQKALQREGRIRLWGGEEAEAYRRGRIGRILPGEDGEQKEENEQRLGSEKAQDICGGLV